MPIGVLIRARRKSLGITQEGLAEAIDKDQNYVSFVETGRIKQPGREVLRLIAAALELDYDEVLLAADYAPERLERRPHSVTDDVVSIRFRGRLPADNAREIEDETEERWVPDIPRGWLGARSPDQFDVFEVYGDCLATLGIVRGRYALVALSNGVEPQNDDIVAVRIGTEKSLKVWRRTGDHIELLNGDGVVVMTLGPNDDVEVWGTYVTDWRPLPHQRVG